jgi:hypothetical protein
MKRILHNAMWTHCPQFTLPQVLFVVGCLVEDSVRILLYLAAFPLLRHVSVLKDSLTINLMRHFSS